MQRAQRIGFSNIGLWVIELEDVQNFDGWTPLTQISKPEGYRTGRVWRLGELHGERFQRRPKPIRGCRVNDDDEFYDNILTTD